MTSVFLRDAADPLTADVVVIATVATDQGPVLAAGAQPVDDALGGVLDQALAALEATGRADEVCKIPTLGLGGDGLRCSLVIATGIGRSSPDRLEPEPVRRAVGAALRSINA